MPLFPSRATSLSHHLSLSLSIYPSTMSCHLEYSYPSPLPATVSFNNHDCFITLVQLRPTYPPTIILQGRGGGGGEGTSSLAEKLKYLSLSPPPSLSPFPPPSPYLEYESPFYPATVKNAASLIQPCRLE